MSRKTLVLSPVLPPSPSGQAIVLYNLLKEMPPDEIVLVCRERYDEDTVVPFECTEKLRSNYYYIPPVGVRTRKILNALFNVGIRAPLEWYLVHHSRKIGKIMEKEQCTEIVVCTADLYDPIGVMTLSKKTAARYFFYVFDDYTDQWVNPDDKKIAQRFEPDIIRLSAGVIVTNEALRDRIEERTCAKTSVIYNPVDLERYSLSHSSIPEPKDEIRIVYTGSIYDAQLDAILDLARAITAIRSMKIVLDIYTNGNPESLRQMGLAGSVRIHPPVANRDIPALQGNADLLFLPLAFKTSYPDSLIQTSLPGKTGEYLASGRPIAVYVPAESFIARYFRENDCGLVVDVKDWHQLGEEVEKFLKDPQRTRRMSENARRCAERDFDLNSARKRFLSTIS